MKAELTGSYYRVTAEPEDVADFMSRWPCSGLDPELAYQFEFSSQNGDIVDIQAFRDGKPARHEDGEALAALSEDACRFGAEYLGLEDVIAMRWSDIPSVR